MLLTSLLLPLALTGVCVGADTIYEEAGGELLNPDYEEIRTMSIPVHQEEDVSTTPTPRVPRRLPVFNVEFHRVETPFIIGIWIVCASLAKIGELINNMFCCGPSV